MSYIQYTHPWHNIFLIDMREERSYPFSALVHKWLEKYIRQKKRILFFVNKKWYASWTICAHCGHIPKCTHCDIAIAVHKQSGNQHFGICHICKTQYTIPPTCPTCKSEQTQQFGIWSQQVQELLQETYDTSSYIIDASNANSPRKIQHTSKDIQHHTILIATSLLITPPLDRIPDLIVVLHADRWLHIPDIGAHRNNFLFLYDIFAKYTKTPTFLVQTFDPEHRSIHYACKHDQEHMKATELERRKEHTYPPYYDVCVILYKHEIEQRLYTATNKLYQELLYLKEHYQTTQLEIYTTPPLVYKTFGKYRYNIVLKWPELRTFMDIVYSKLNLRTRGFKIDREPNNLV